ADHHEDARGGAVLERVCGPGARDTGWGACAAARARRVAHGGRRSKRAGDRGVERRKPHRDAARPGRSLGAGRSSLRSPGRELARAEEGVIVRRVDAEVIPPLSDYDAFWKREVPFLFLTSGRSQRYHTPQDTPEHLDWRKMEATARWLEAMVRRACARPEDRV